METVRKGNASNGTPQVFDTAVYNRLTKKWEREGKRLTRKQASNRLAYRNRTSPYAEYKVVKVSGRRTKAELENSK